MFIKTSKLLKEQTYIVAANNVIVVIAIVVVAIAAVGIVVFVVYCGLLLLVSFFQISRLLFVLSSFFGFYGAA